MKYYHALLYMIVCLSLTSCLSGHVSNVKNDTRPVSHELWNTLLQKNVSDEGWVDYEGFISDRETYDSYLTLLESNHPNSEYWTEDERKAYWINVYNAYTIKLIIDHYPVESIKDIKNGIPFVNTVWDIKFIKIGNSEYDLNNIEHGILRRKFDDARIHFAVNCASVSCPPLANFAFEATELDAQLDKMGKRFLNDTSRNRINNKSEIQISSIFSWFKGDFTKQGSLISFLNRFAEIEIEETAKVDFLDYDWNLNDSRD